MDVIHVKKSDTLDGTVTVQGSKNAVLPILAATILTGGACELYNCPKISDVDCMLRLLKSMGCQVEWDEEKLIIDTSAVFESRLPGELVSCMRSSLMLLGPMLAVCKEAVMNYPGGCVIGERPVDIHLAVLEKLGACFITEKDNIRGYAKKLTGTDVWMRFPSVGATENGIMAAVLAEGRTVLRNCAKEPEIKELCLFLNRAGADISGIGTETIIINGVHRLKPVSYRIDADRIVAGTYLLAVAAVGGNVHICNAPTASMRSVIETAELLGCEIKETDVSLHVRQSDRPKSIPYIKTQVYPGFSTDLQSVLFTTLAVSRGESVLEETIFSDRFKIADELVRMGADIHIEGNCVYIRGFASLKGRNVFAKDLRGGAALVLAGLLAEGDTFVRNGYYIRRGYEDIGRDFRLLGAFVEDIG